MNCLTYAISRWHEHGGALRIVRSRHWGMPHVMHERTKGERYGWLDLLTQQVLRLPVDDAGWFCSEWCAAGIGLTDPEIWSPVMLARRYGVDK